MTLPTLTDLLLWAHEDELHVSIEFFMDQGWTINIINEDVKFTCDSLNNLCEFLHGYLRGRKEYAR